MTASSVCLGAAVMAEPGKPQDKEEQGLSWAQQRKIFLTLECTLKHNFYVKQGYNVVQNAKFV